MKKKVLIGALIIIVVLIVGIGINSYKRCHGTAFEEFDFSRDYFFDERFVCDGDVGPIENEIMAKEKALAFFKGKYGEDAMKRYKSIRISYDSEAEVWRIICYHIPPDCILVLNRPDKSPCVYIQSDGKVIAAMD
jgi:hypothetical protein